MQNTDPGPHGPARIEETPANPDFRPVREEAEASRVWRDVDFAQKIKILAALSVAPARYSPPKMSGTGSRVVDGNAGWKKFGASYVERRNLTMRIGMKRLTGLTNAFGKMMETLKAAVALHYAYHNIVRIHRILPAMEAGMTGRIWAVFDFMEHSA